MIESAWVIGLSATVVLAIITQTGLLWRKLGQLESAVKRACPFGVCPVFARATKEAAPTRAEASQDAA